MLERTNLLSAFVTVAIYILYILLFIFRLLGMSQFGHWLASVQFVSVIPFVYLLVKASQLERPMLYYVQIGLMLVFLLVELMLDYVFNIEFRQVRWMVISYVTLFFAATGGLLGLVANTTKRTWIVSSVILFFIMAALAFVQRAVTGM